MKHLPKDPGVYVFRDERGRPLYVGKSVSLRTRARAHFCAPSGWTERAEVADYRPTNSELGALVLENRLIKQWRPPGNKALKRTDKWAYVLCRLDVEYPVLEVSAEPASGRAVSIGPVRGKKLAGDLADHLTSMYRLRHCGRRLHPARAPVDLRPDGPLLLALPWRPGPQRLPRPGGQGAGAVRARARCRRAAAGGDRRADGGRRRASAATSARPHCCAGASGWKRCWGAWTACCGRCTPTRGWCWPATPSSPASTRCGWSTARVADWGPLPERAGEVARAQPGGAGRGAGAPIARRYRPRTWTRCGSPRPGWPSTGRLSWRWRRRSSPSGWSASWPPRQPE